MTSIEEILTKYSSKIDSFDLELLIAHDLKKPREFVLAHPEHKLTKSQISNLKSQILRRRRGKPLAYILGEKEFYGLKFKVNKNVLIPRPETELLAELAIREVESEKIGARIIDIGTGSGNITISIAKAIDNFQFPISNIQLFATDISAQALNIAKQNAKLHKVDKKIKFIKGNLLKPLIRNWKLEIGNSRAMILANLPYLSPAIYRSSQKSVKMYEPKNALLATKSGLLYYDELLDQIRQIRKQCCMFHAACFMEISPEQKPTLQKLIKKYFPKAEIKFYRDLANKWRVCSIEIKN